MLASALGVLFKGRNLARLLGGLWVTLRLSAVSILLSVALGLALDCLRNISTCNSVVRKGGTKVGLVGHELSGRTVGIVGTGDTGSRTRPGIRRRRLLLRFS